MLFLDDFLEMLDELPAELREKCTEMRHIDMQVEAGLAQNRLALIDFFDHGGHLTDEQKQHRYKELQKEYDRLRILGEMKVSLAERMQEVLETYMQYLDKEKTHFKYELEADNPGITEVIETRFANYCESLIALRKERKRKLINGSIDSPAESLSKIPKISSEGNSLSSYVRSELTTLGEDEPVSPMVSGAGTVKSKKSSIEEYNIMKRRSTPVSLKTSLSVPSALNTCVDSPAVSEKSWTPLSSAPALDELIPCSTLAPMSTVSSTQLTPTTASTMPTFVGPESRHGRPRKLTSRVQEMFKEAVQRQRHHHCHRSNDTTHIADFNTEDDDDISDGEEDESDDSKRKWCFCNEKSYGDMVACDNKGCPYQWFHYPCVNISSTPKGRWYCPHCTNERLRRSDSGDSNSASGTAIL